MAFTPQSTPTVVPSNLVNDRDHGALVTVTAALCIVFSLLFCLARLVVRWPWKRLLGRDDAVTGAALFFSVTQSILVMADVQAGFGRTEHYISSQAAVAVLRAQYASDIIFVISSCLGRLAVALLFVRLLDHGHYRHQTRLQGALIITLACILYGFASVLIIAIRHPSVVEPSLFDRWIAIAAMGDVLDVSLAIFPFVLVSSPLMRRSAKITIITGFGMRLLLIALSTLRLISLSRTISSPDYTLALADSEIWTQFEIHYNVVAATIPCLRPFLRAFYTEQLTKMVIVDDDPSIPSTAATKGQSSTPLRSVMASALSGNAGAEKNTWRLSAFETTIRGYGKTESSAMRNDTRNNPGDGASMASDWSKRAIVVRQTVDVRHADD